jgi:hypothetical protein
MRTICMCSSCHRHWIIPLKHHNLGTNPSKHSLYFVVNDFFNFMTLWVWVDYLSLAPALNDGESLRQSVKFVFVFPSFVLTVNKIWAKIIYLQLLSSTSWKICQCRGLAYHNQYNPLRCTLRKNCIEIGWKKTAMCVKCFGYCFRNIIASCHY